MYHSTHIVCLVQVRWMRLPITGNLYAATLQIMVFPQGRQVLRYGTPRVPLTRVHILALHYIVAVGQSMFQMHRTNLHFIIANYYPGALATTAQVVAIST